MHSLNILLNSVKSGRVAHAYLFEGPADSNKAEAANLFARALLCLNPPDNGNSSSFENPSCGCCKSCKMFLNSSHPNFKFLSVEGDTIKIREHIVPFFQNISLSSPYPGKKIYIINEAHKMNSASQNSILKTLEEPHSDVLIILLTENSELLLPTILSRVIRYTFASEHNIPIEYELTQTFMNIMKNIESSKASDRISASTELTAMKNNCEIIFDMMQMYYRNSLTAKYTNNEMLINGFKTDKISANGAVLAVKYIGEARFAIKSNANVQLVMDVLVTKLNNLRN